MSQPRKIIFSRKLKSVLVAGEMFGAGVRGDV